MRLAFLFGFLRRNFRSYKAGWPSTRSRLIVATKSYPPRPDCGSRIYHTGTDESDILSIKGGSLDVIHRINPVGHIWTDSALEWIKHENLQGFIYTHQPDSFDDMIAKFVPPVLD